jgi:hypothetical protein
MHAKLISSAIGAALLVGSTLATAQTTPQKDQPTKSDTAKVTLTEGQAKSWINKPVYSSDGKEIGEVFAFKRAADNTVIEMHVDIGGMFGIGETRVKLTPQQFKLKIDRIVLNVTEAEANNLPIVEG